MADCQTIDVSDIAGIGSSQVSEQSGDNEFGANIWGRLYPLNNAYTKVEYHGYLVIYSGSRLIGTPWE